MTGARYDAGGFVDLEHAKTHVRQMIAAAISEGDMLSAAQVDVATRLAEQMRQRPGRDPVAAGEAMLEASQCLAGIATLQGHLHGYVVVVVNVLGIAGVILSDTPVEAKS